MAFSSAVTISTTLLEPLPFHFQDKVIVSLIEIVATRVHHGFNQSSRFVQEIEIEKPLQIFFIGADVDKTPFLFDCCWKKNDLVLFLNVGPETFCRKDELSKSFIRSNIKFVIFSVLAFNHFVVGFKADK